MIFWFLSVRFSLALSKGVSQSMRKNASVGYKGQCNDIMTNGRTEEDYHDTRHLLLRLTIRDVQTTIEHSVTCGW